MLNVFSGNSNARLVSLSLAERNFSIKDIDVMESISFYPLLSMYCTVVKVHICGPAGQVLHFLKN